MELSPDRQAVTQLLRQWSNGNKEALDQLMPFVYDQLRKLASNCLRVERPDHTLRARTVRRSMAIFIWVNTKNSCRVCR